MNWTLITVGGLGLFLLGYLFGRISGTGSRNLSGPPPLERQAQAREVFGTLDPATHRSVTLALAARKKIEAIKILREATGMGLKESKETVEAWERAALPGP